MQIKQNRTFESLWIRNAKRRLDENTASLSRSLTSSELRHLKSIKLYCIELEMRQQKSHNRVSSPPRGVTCKPIPTQIYVLVDLAQDVTFTKYLLFFL